MIKERGLDPNEVAWSRVRKETELDSAAKYVSRELAKYRLILDKDNEENFTTTAAAREYTLVATDIGSILKVVRLDDDSNPYAECRQIDERESRDSAGNFDDTWRFFVKRKTKSWLICFPQDPPVGIAFTVTYGNIPASIATGAGNDGLAYDSIPETWHELVVARALFILTASDDSQASFAAALYTDLLGQMRSEATSRAGGQRIRQVW